MKRKSFILIMIIIFSQIILGMNILENSSFDLPLSNNIPDTQGMVNTENSWDNTTCYKWICSINGIIFNGSGTIRINIYRNFNLLPIL